MAKKHPTCHCGEPLPCEEHTGKDGGTSERLQRAVFYDIKPPKDDEPQTGAGEG